MNIINFAKNVVDIELSALEQFKNNLDDNFIQAVDILQNCTGKVVVTGMGKSGHIGKKIAATLASTGTPSFFLHPAEAGHGDLGMISENDVLIGISYSGTASEIMLILPIVKRLGVKTIAITGNKNAVMSQECDIWLNASVETEACPHNLAPTSSTTVALVLGDALAMSLLQQRGFSANDFARSHPSGALGKKLLTNTKDIMHTDLPLVKIEDNLLNSLVIMSSKKLGMLIAINEKNELIGVFTDGDLRRILENKTDITNLTIAQAIHTNPQSIEANTPAVKALALMQEFKINSLPVIENNQVVGAINMQTLIQNKII
jgi:arabinose-5-phosphate isomerase